MPGFTSLTPKTNTWDPGGAAYNFAHPQKTDAMGNIINEPTPYPTPAPLDETELLSLLGKYFGMSSGMLNSMISRQVSGARNAGMAQGGQMNLSNPYAYSNFFANRTAGELAPQMGNLATSYLGAQAQVPMQAWQSHLGSAQFGLSARGEANQEKMGMLNYQLQQRALEEQIAQANDWLRGLGGFIGDVGGSVLKTQIPIWME